MIRLELGDSVEVLKRIESASIDALVCDPPAGISFMGKEWDRDHGHRDEWVKAFAAIFREALRTMKPGAHGLVWALPRTSHWTATALEDAGFEVRDIVMHLFGTGFPKSLDVAKAIDKSGGAVALHLQHRVAFAREIRAKRAAAGMTRAELAAWFPQYSAVTANWEREDAGFRIPAEADFDVLIDRLGVVDDKGWRGACRAEDLRRKTEETRTARTGDGTVFGLGHSGEMHEATTDDAKKWRGWGTALKPAAEHWILVRKPLAGTVAANVLKFGTGGINIDASRIATSDDLNGGAYAENGSRTDLPGSERSAAAAGMLAAGKTTGRDFKQPTGRFPANVTLDEEAAALLDVQSGESESRRGKPRGSAAPGAGWGMTKTGAEYDDTGGASRFFYVAKASKADKGADNDHPTPKNTKLMEYLIRMITPPGGVVLDCFMGSGSTGVAARALGFRFIGIERDPHYFEIAQRRLDVVPEFDPITAYD